MKQVLFVVFILITIQLYSQSNNPISVSFIDVEVEIDGELTESVWSDIAPFSNFYNHFPLDSGYAQNQTEVQVFHNGQYLFIAAVYHDNQPNNNISSLKRDNYNDGMHLSDCFGVLLDPYNEGNNGYLFSLNASGVQFDALIGNINSRNENWNAVWESAVSKQGNDKFYELAIPLDAINFDAQKNSWGIQFYTNDTKQTLYSTLIHNPRNFLQYDLRFTTAVTIDNLQNTVLRKFSVVPSLAANYTDDKSNNTKIQKFIPSLDVRYNITSALRMDATLNPDFSQVDVDQQVFNLTRFAINFPEKRKFFLENSDLFTNLGMRESNPFYSRRIGAESDIVMGAKISGNLSSNTRIGLLNVQTSDKNEGQTGKNYSVLVGRQKLSNALNATMFLINSQQSTNFNRVAGTNFNFKSKNNKWTSDFNYSKSFVNEKSTNNSSLNARVAYETRKFDWNVSIQKVNENFDPETGFVPFLDNYDALTEQTTKEGFTVLFGEIQLKHYLKKSKSIDWMRKFWVINKSVFNQDNTLRESFTFYSPFAIRFKKSNYFYSVIMNKEEHLSFNFDFLQNGNFIAPRKYNYTYGRVGYRTASNKKTYYAFQFEGGQFYDGLRMNPSVIMNYRLLPAAVLSANYIINHVNLNHLGKKTFHLAKFTAEIFFNNKLNWTTYLQYNTQRDNFNINSRLQWEYRPLSYAYLVLSNNYDNNLLQKNWGISLKVNRRFDF